MVLKRLFATVLGALGLSALAAGSAFAQQGPGDGNIPAPDIFDDQITCSMNVAPTMGPDAAPRPTVRPTTGNKMSVLDELIGKGESTLITDTANSEYDARIAQLGYVIDPAGGNCGLGTGSPAFNAITVGMADTDPNTVGNQPSADYNPGEGSIPTDVATGYSLALDRYMAVYGAPGVAEKDRSDAQKGTAQKLREAQKALADAIERGSTGPALTPLQNAITRAQEAHNKAMTAFNNVGGGPIVSAGVTEWMAKAAVSNSIRAYNDQVTKAVAAKTALDDMDFSKYVPLGNPELVGESGDVVVTYNPTTGKATVNNNQLIQYTNGDLQNLQVGTHGMAGMGTGDGSAGNAAPVASDTSASNFDVQGNLIVPMVVNADTDDPTDIRAVIDSTNNGVDQIRARVEAVNAAAAALKKARDDNAAAGGLNQRVFDVAYDRAQKEANYYNEQWAKVLADNTDTRSAADKLPFVDSDGDGVRDPGEADNPTYKPNVVSIASRHATYTTESNKRFTEEQNLRAAVAAREAATAQVQRQFNSPQSFYEQLVARRSAVKVAADRAVANASKDGATPSKTLTDAAEDAAKALTAAEEAQGKFAELFDNPDDPTVALINTLLENGGDDGRALVDAISATYDVASGAADAAREVVDELTGEGGQVSMNTAAISENADDIEDLDGRVAKNEGEIWDEDGNSRIDANETRSMMNSEMIKTNVDNIAKNAANIMTNTMEIGYGDDGMSRIDHNEADIMTNAGHIKMNADNIKMNTDAIAGLGNRVGANESAIQRNSGMIGDLSEQMEVVRAGVAASMALAGMPAINGRGISIGVGSYDGESAFAVGFQIQGEMASFKVGVTSAGGETGASAGVGFQF